MKKNVLKSLVCMGMLLCLSACGKMKVTVNENIETEYGKELDTAALYDVKQSDEDVKVKEVKGFDAKKIGEQEITVVFVNGDEKTAEEKVKVNVKDTKAPEIKFKKDKLEITAGDDFNPASNIESVKDPIDGDIKKSDDKKITKNGYIIISDVDTKKVKDGYKVKITAFDVNGNKAEKEYTVNVKAKSEEKPQASTSQPTSTSQGGGASSGNTQAPTSSTSSTPANVCPRTGQAPINPALSCDTVLWPPDQPGYYIPHIKFNTIDEAYAWGDDQMMKKSEYSDKYSGFVTGNLCTNDGYCDWGEIAFY